MDYEGKSFDMKKTHFFIIGITILILPIIAIGFVYAFLSKNIFDNPDFWYGYMAYFGTACLAMVSLWQNENANKINEKLNQLQESEYTPTLLITTFVGVTKFGMVYSRYNYNNDIFLVEMRTDDNDVKLGHAVSLTDDDFNEKISSVPRIYEIHFKGVNKSLITMLKIKSISFIGKNFQRNYLIDKSIDIAINNDDFIFFIYHFSNAHKDNMSENPFLNCGKISFKILIFTSLNKVFEENITVNKHFVKKGFKDFPEGNIELMLSSSFEIKEIQKNK